jgi:DoxX-like family
MSVNAVLWVVAVLLALVFAGAGALKALRPKEKVIEVTGGWAGDFPPAALKALGVAELLGAVGLVLPAAVGVAPVLVPLAATALALVMAGATLVHGRRGEGADAAKTVVLLALAVWVAWGRFGPYPF